MKPEKNAKKSAGKKTVSEKELIQKKIKAVKRQKNDCMEILEKVKISCIEEEKARNEARDSLCRQQKRLDQLNQEKLKAEESKRRILYFNRKIHADLEELRDELKREKEENEKNEAEKERLEKNISRKRVELSSVMSELEKIRARFIAIDRETDEKSNERDEYKRENRTREEKLHRLNAEVEILRQNLEEENKEILQKEKKILENRAELSIKRKELKKAGEELKRLKKEVGDLEERLENRDYTAQKNKLLVAQKLNQAILKDYDRIEEEVAQLNGQMRATREACNARKKDQICIQDSIKKENERTKEQIQKIRENILALRAEKEKLSVQELELSLQLEKEKNWMESLEADKYRRGAQKLAGRLKAIQDVKEKLQGDLEGMWGQEIKDKMRDSSKLLEKMDEDMLATEQKLEKYQSTLLEFGQQIAGIATSHE